MPVFMPHGFFTLGFATFVLSHAWYREREDREEEQGGPDILNDVDPIIYLPTAREDAFHLLLRSLHERQIQGFALGDDGAIHEVDHIFWASSELRSDIIHHFLIDDVPISSIPTRVSGKVLARPIVKVHDINQLKNILPESVGLVNLKSKQSKGSPKLDYVIDFISKEKINPRLIKLKNLVILVNDGKIGNSRISSGTIKRAHDALKKGDKH